MFDFIVVRIIRVLFRLKRVKINENCAVYGIEIHTNRNGVVFTQKNQEWMLPKTVTVKANRREVEELAADIKQMYGK